eukprot:COSAG06_NODE_9287_length_1938_cov_3.995106_2_plen_175_part_00
MCNCPSTLFEFSVREESSRGERNPLAPWSLSFATVPDRVPLVQAHPLAMEPWTADPGSWQDMGDVVDDWMGEPAGGMGELDDNLRALDSHADLASFGGGPYPQMQDVDGDYAADGSRFNATVGDASEAAEPRAPPFGQTSPPRHGLCLANQQNHTRPRPCGWPRPRRPVASSSS